jgi:nitric oxide dioxygenase
VGVTLPDGARQLRQYSLVGGPGAGVLTFAVKPIDAAGDAPAGEVSTFIRDNLAVGDLVDVTLPFGDLPAPAQARPTVLVSAGIGVTPMISLLEHFAAADPGREIRVLHADRSKQEHPLRDRQRELVDRLPHASLDVWYEDTATGVAAGHHVGRMSLDAVSLPAEAEVYLCGNDGFVRALRTQLTELGVPAERVHCELFSPNDWLLT